MQESKQNNWPSQEFVGELALLMSYVSVGIKESKKKKNSFDFIKFCLNVRKVSSDFRKCHAKQ